jgi:dienelactone hydrolase
MDVVLFHSMWGLRPGEQAAAERLRSLGHRVTMPDLFDGRTTPGEIDAGFALMAEIGWDTITGRAFDALADVSENAALIGFSMGVGVIGEVWPTRLGAAAVACLHAPTSVPAGVRRGTPVQLHYAAGDRFVPPEQVAAFRRTGEAAGAVMLIREYDGAGHFFTDESHPDYSPTAAAQTWDDVLTMVQGARNP